MKLLSNKSSETGAPPFPLPGDPVPSEPGEHSRAGASSQGGPCRYSTLYSTTVQVFTMYDTTLQVFYIVYELGRDKGYTVE